MSEKRTKKKIAKLKYKQESANAKAAWKKDVGKDGAAWRQESKALKYKYKAEKLESKVVNKTRMVDKIPKMNRINRKDRGMMGVFLTSIVNLYVPQHMESGTTSELVIRLNNSSEHDFERLGIDPADLSNYFNIEPLVQFPSLRVGMSIEKRVNFSPKHGDGIYPVKIKISGNGVMVEKEYTIKVGGTEVY